MNGKTPILIVVTSVAIGLLVFAGCSSEEKFPTSGDASLERDTIDPVGEISLEIGPLVSADATFLRAEITVAYDNTEGALLSTPFLESFIEATVYEIITEFNTISLFDRIPEQDRCGAASDAIKRRIEESMRDTQVEQENVFGVSVSSLRFCPNRIRDE